MSLKELTSKKHQEAEQCKFMQALMSHKLSTEVWADFIFQKWLVYKTLEGLGGAYCGLNQVPDIYRTVRIFDDYRELSNNKLGRFVQSAIEYHNYLIGLGNQTNKIMSHIYVWHMGDLYGGQMIKRLAPGKNLHLDFDNKDQVIHFIRTNLSDDMAHEANLAFDYAIRIMNDLF